MLSVRRWALGAALCVSALVMGCGAVVQPGDPSGDGGLVLDAQADRVDPSVDAGRVCRSGVDCPGGMACLGGEGCGTPWTCQPALGRPCTADLSPFCGCDGQTFFGSSTCPDRPFARRGACEASDGGSPDLSCRLPGGGVCQNGQVCPAGDGCNTCRCVNGQAQCTLIGCVDGGAPVQRCRRHADCPSGFCEISAPGCDTVGRCVDTRPACTRDAVDYCTCSGSTVSASSSCPPELYAYRGRCGVPMVDAGVDGGIAGCRLPTGAFCASGQVCYLDPCNRCRCNRDGTATCETSPNCPSVDAGPAGCALPQGGVCPFGATCAVDRCTSCVCGRDGSLACSGVPGCGAVDAGVDAGPRACRLPNGGVCPAFGRCQVDRCTVCYCDGNGSLSCGVDANCTPQDAGVDGGFRTPCVANRDCPAGSICDGPAGCGVQWTCQASRGCTADLVSYCGCDGRVFQSSSSCPGRPYQNRGTCGIVPPPVDAGVNPGVCTAQRASGEGACDLFLGYAWNGARCQGVSGCRCVGADCANLSRDLGECQRRYAMCPVPL